MEYEHSFQSDEHQLPIILWVRIDGLNELGYRTSHQVGLIDLIFVTNGGHLENAGAELEILMAEDPIVKFFNWESRPAVVLASGLTYAIVSRDGGWVPVNRTSVLHSGERISEETFSNSFPNLDPRTIPSASPDK